MKKILFILLFVFSFNFQTASASGIVKWVDSDGKVHYGAAAPNDGSKTSSVKITPAPASAKSKGGSVSEACGKVRYVDGLDPCKPLPPGMKIYKGDAELDDDRRALESQREH